MLVNKERAKRSLLTLHGTITFTRTCLVPADAESAEVLQREYHRNSVVPLDDALEISGLPFKITWQAMSKIAREATKSNSYADASAELKVDFGEKISVSTIERVTDYVGTLMFQYQCDEASNAEKLAKTRKIDARRIRKQEDDVLYVMTDGAMIHVRDKEHVGMTNEEICKDETEKKSDAEVQHDSGWTESKHAICFHARDIKYYFEKADGSKYSGRFNEALAVLKKKGKNMTKITGHQIEQRDCIGLIGKSDQFQYHLLALAERHHWAYTTKVVILSDGAGWIKTAKNTLFKRKNVIQILDMYHAKENAGKFASAVKRTEKTKKEYADHLCSLIENGKVEELLQELKPFEDQKMKPGIPNLYTYILNNKDGMAYPTYKACGLFVGSGAMESANIYMMQDRMKLQGMRWNVATGRKMLCLKSFHESHTWGKVDEILRQNAVALC